MMQEVMIPASQGRALEGYLHTKGTGDLAVLLVHPYAALGGSMHDPVIVTLLRSLAETSDVRCALAYNQAGVGRSSGKGFFQSSTDSSDFQAAVAYLHSRDSEILEVFVVGYSYGSCVAATGLAGLKVSGFAIIAPPIGIMANLFLQSRAMLRQSRSFKHPVFIIHGDVDQFASLSQIQDFVEEFRQERRKHSWPQVLCLEGCDHFFHGQQQSVAEAVCDWLLSVAALSNS